MKSGSFLSSILLVLLFLQSFYSCRSTGAAGSHFQIELTNTLAVAGRQGVATDGQVYVVSGSKALYKYSLTGQLLLENQQPFEGLNGPANHIGDIVVANREVYAGVENFTQGRGENIQIVVYDLATLKYKRSIPWEPTSGQVEVCGVAVDGPRQTIWLADWLNGQYLYRYNLTTGAYQGRVELVPPPRLIQGITVRGDWLLLTADDGNADQVAPDHLYAVNIAQANEQPSVVVQQVKMLDDFRRTGEVEGLCIFPAGRRLTILANRGRRIVRGMPRGLYPGYEKEIHELYIYRIKD